MKKAWLLGVLLAAGSFTAIAADTSAVEKQIEYSMLVTGTIDIATDGSVSGVRIDKPGKLPAGLVTYVNKQVSTWKFEPVLVDGKPAPAGTHVSLRAVAKKRDDGDISLTIRNASFAGEPPPADEIISAKSLNPPPYPMAAATRGAQGTVYVVVKVGSSGRVEDVVVEQVNLRTVGTETEMTLVRSAFAEAAAKAARRWTFKPPTKGEQAAQAFWLVRVPATFTMDPRHAQSAGGYGKWEVYVPGPRQAIPWENDESPASSPDTFAAGVAYMLGQRSRPKLVTALDGT